MNRSTPGLHVHHQLPEFHLLTWGVPLSVSYYFAFSYCSWGSQGKNTEVVCHSLLQWTTFCQTSPPRPVHLGWPHTAWLSFIELDKAVVHVIRLASFLWMYTRYTLTHLPLLHWFCTSFQGCWTIHFSLTPQTNKPLQTIILFCIITVFVF